MCLLAEDYKKEKKKENNRFYHREPALFVRKTYTRATYLHIYSNIFSALIATQQTTKKNDESLTNWPLKKN